MNGVDPAAVDLPATISIDVTHLAETPARHEAQGEDSGGVEDPIGLAEGA